MAGDHPS